ncbi:hypothetical protein [Planctomyces sp. SH-PL14]|uniref:hypothetical protein n=1 Tax=Planctomyces sp. SH-PL14 TaxID=1632864 RepID=UPI00078C63AA|nr:hypothetical protein [Planctomyces sp. SH-PL14]AMV20889.1 hypothetical protein VT03_23505 [Planctomyces sp. SH-PL14]
MLSTVAAPDCPSGPRTAASTGRLATFLLLCLLFPSVAPAAEPTGTTLAQVREAYEASLVRLSRLECVVHYEKARREPLPPNFMEPGLELGTRFDVRSLLDGDRFAHAEHGRSDTGRTEWDHWIGFDGKHHGEWWHTTRHSLNWLQPPTGSISFQPRDRHLLTIRDLLGLRIWEKTSLSSVLADPMTELEEAGMYGGSPAARIRSGAIRGEQGSGPRYQIAAWLDLAQGGLPSRIEFIDLNWSPLSGSATSGWEWQLTVREFQNLAAEGEAPVWLPRSAVRESNHETWPIQVDDARLPDSVDIEQFQPAFPSGTAVTAETRPDFIAGGEEGRRLYDKLHDNFQVMMAERRAKRLAEQQAAPPAPPDDPHPPPLPTWALVLCGGGGLIVLWIFAVRGKS